MTNCIGFEESCYTVCNASFINCSYRNNLHSCQIATLLITHHSMPRKLSLAQLEDVSQTSEQAPLTDFHLREMTVPRCLSLQFGAAVQPLCSLTSPPRPCFVPTLCPVESLAPTFSNHNYIPAKRRQQGSKDRHSMKGKGLTITDI